MQEAPRLSLRWVVKTAVLALLAAEGPMHGYAIYKRLLAVFSRARLLSPSLVYTILSELEREGMVEEAGFEEGAPSGGRRLLRVTQRGLLYLAEQASLAWRLFADLAAMLAEGEATARLQLGDYGGLITVASDAEAYAERLRSLAAKILGETPQQEQDLKSKKQHYTHNDIKALLRCTRPKAEYSPRP